MARALLRTEPIYFGSPFFFFQAEDGIRDWSVTGVQTCALPICAHLDGAGRRRGRRIARESARGCLQRARPAQLPGVWRAFLSDLPRAGANPGDDCLGRSEERRVGKGVGERGGGEDEKEEEVGCG